jgi:phosphopantothenoylcysteine decarboxylase/phosphopantothenate--cysteine ligase
VGGHADDLLSACLLATTAPTLLVPAMNDRMWAHPQVRRNADAARDIGYCVLDPDDGALAVGEGSGPGRMPEPATILAHCARLLEAPTALAGRTIVVTAGPTREPLDPVRFLSNRSSGKMGVAIAAAAWRRGANVILIAGPLDVAVPVGVRVVRVETTAHMRDAVAQSLPGADALIMAAAPADFAAAAPANAKIKKATLSDSLALTRTDDILATTRGSRSTSCVTVGFALETGDARNEARRKLADKGLDFIVANDALEDGAGFAVDTNRVTIVHADGREEALPLQHKTQVADELLDRVEVLLRGR